MKKNLLYNIIVLIIVFIISGSSIISTKWYNIGLTSFLLVLFLMQKKDFTKKIVIILAVWFAITILAIFATNSDLVLMRLLNYTFSLILLPYLALSLMGINFWFRLEKIIYTLTIISLPVFFLNILFSQYFDSLSSIFRPLTREIFYQFDPTTNYWSSLIYVNAIKEGLVYRNSGFMWEPGSFAMLIIWGIIFNWLTQGIKFNIKFWIYTIAMATTLSTAGFLAIFVIILSHYIKKFSFKNIFLILPLVFLFWTYIYQLDFVGGEIDYYIEGYKENATSYNADYKAIKVSRFQIVDYDLQKVLEYPLGYGVVSKKDFSEETDIVGVNGLSNLMVMWGVPAFIFIIILIKRYVFLFNLKHYSNLTLYILFFGLLIMFFSNPLARNVFVYLILMTSFIFKLQKNTHGKLR